RLGDESRQSVCDFWRNRPVTDVDDCPGAGILPVAPLAKGKSEPSAHLFVGRAAPQRAAHMQEAIQPTSSTLEAADPVVAAALRRHRVDALAGMLTELIAASQRYDEANGNGNGRAATAEELELQQVEDEDEDSTLVVEIADAELPEEPQQDDHGAVRRYRFRHPTASGKTIAAAGFVEAARTLGVLILTHRRLLVSQF